jgi:polar amino acid transport system permease protein
MPAGFWAYAFPQLGWGLLYTVIVTVIGTILALATAFIAGIGRLSDHAAIRGISVVFIELFRGTSLVVQLFFFFFALPAIGIELSPLLAGIVAVGLNEGAYAAEIVRSAVVTRAAGQNEACIALNMGKSLRMRRILIPQSIPAMLPPFGNIAVDLLKNSSLVSFIGVTDLTFRASFIRNTYGQTMTVYLMILVMYFLLSQLIGLLSRWLERRFSIDRPSRSFLRAARNKPLTIAGVGA